MTLISIPTFFDNFSQSKSNCTQTIDIIVGNFGNRSKCFRRSSKRRSRSALFIPTRNQTNCFHECGIKQSLWPTDFMVLLWPTEKNGTTAERAAKSRATLSWRQIQLEYPPFGSPVTVPHEPRGQKGSIKVVIRTAPAGGGINGTTQDENNWNTGRQGNTSSTRDQILFFSFFSISQPEQKASNVTLVVYSVPHNIKYSDPGLIYRQ